MSLLATDRPVLETPRLLIRIDTEEQFIAFFRNHDQETVKRRFGLLTDHDLQVQQDKIAGGFTNYRTGVLFFHLIEKELDCVIGSFAYHNWYPMHRRSEIGYALVAEEYKNRGYMREAVPHTVRYGFDQLNLNRMEAFISPANLPSQRLVERLGFTVEGTLKEHYNYNDVLDDSVLYALLQQDYRARQ